MKMPVVLCQKTVPVPRTQRFCSAPAPSSKTSHLANRLHQNWLARHPTDNGGISLDDSLTSLAWLQNLNILKITAPTPPPSPGSSTSNSDQKIVKDGSSSLGHLGDLSTRSCKQDARVPLADTPPLCGSSLLGPDTTDYRTNPYVKPPYSYATLICMAMKETKKHKITLSSIYNWITEHFIYYRMAEPSWQNSIRHNLSLNKCFEKVPRRKDEPGKGGFWRINPEYSDMIENGIFKKRRASRDSCPVPPTKRVKKEDELLMAVNSIKGTREDKLLSNGSMLHYGEHSSYEDDDSLTLRPDFNWSSILNQDIDIGGVRIKTEQIIDSDDSGPLIAMSPPSSDTNSDDLGLDDLFSQTDISMDVPLDCTTHDTLNLTVTGRGIRPPEWWADNLLHEMKIEPDDHAHNSGLHTPVQPSPNSDQHDMWESMSELGGHRAFDLDNLFDFGDIPSPPML